MAELKRRKSKYAYLPNEILSNILVRLPVKHILRFKTVCRPWRALITSNDFVKLHLNYSKQSPCPEDGALIFMGKNNHSLYVASLGSRTRFRAVKLNLVDRLDIGNIVGCCNGLVLCHERKWATSAPLLPDLVLVNPSTLRYKRVATLASGQIRQLRYHEAIGFGYDHITDDYKVIVVVLNDDREDETFIYSSRADSWRKFTGDMPVIRSIISYSKGVLLNNHLLHWYIRDTHQVYCFDITTEKWSAIPLPERSGKSVDVVTDMVVQNGLLFISGGWYKDGFREGKLGLFTPTIRFQSSTLVKECYTGCNRTLVNL